MFIILVSAREIPYTHPSKFAHAWACTFARALENDNNNNNSQHDNNNNDTSNINVSIDISNNHSMYLRSGDAEEEWGIAVKHIIAWLCQSLSIAW